MKFVHNPDTRKTMETAFNSRCILGVFFWVNFMIAIDELGLSPRNVSDQVVCYGVVVVRNWGLSETIDSI